MTENDQHHPIIALPEEVRGKIFNSLPQQDVLTLRLVCKQWRQEVDKYVDFNIQLDDRSPYLKKILGRRIKKCEVVHCKNTLPVRQDTGSIFKYPKLVRTLEIRTGDFSSENCITITKSIEGSLGTLIVDRRTYQNGPTEPSFLSLIRRAPDDVSLYNNREEPVPVEFGFLRFIEALRSTDFNFCNLRKLQIVFLDANMPDDKSTDPPFDDQNLDEQIPEIPIMTKLKSIKIHIKFLGMCYRGHGLRRFRKFFPVLVLKLISNNWKSLESVNIEIPYTEMFTRHDVRRPILGQLSASELELFRKVDSMSKLRIRVASEDDFFPADVVIELAANQKKLTMIEIEIQEYYKVPHFLCRQVVFNNMDTLEYFAMYALNIRPNDPNTNDDAEEKRPKK